MKKLIAGLMLMFAVVSVADAASRVSSSRSSFKPSASRAYSAPKQTAPKASGGYSGSSFFNSKPAASSQPAVKPTLKSLGFTKPQVSGRPASVQTVVRPSVNVSPKTYSAPRVVTSPVQKTTSTSGGWFAQKRVSSTPTSTVRSGYVTRKVVSPTVYRSRPVVIQRNYYNYGGYNGYNRGYGGYYGGGYGYNSGFGTNFMGSALGTFAGMSIYNSLTNHSATAAQIADAKQDQRIEDKMDQILANQQRGAAPVGVTPVAYQPQCAYPQDAPLVMSYSFYCQPQNNR